MLCVLNGPRLVHQVLYAACNKILVINTHQHALRYRQHVNNHARFCPTILELENGGWVRAGGKFGGEDNRCGWQIGRSRLQWESTHFKSWSDGIQALEQYATAHQAFVVAQVIDWHRAEKQSKHCFGHP